MTSGTSDPSPAGHALHNPDNLTPEQYGKAEGWRLLDEDEVTKEGQPFIDVIARWSNKAWSNGANGHWGNITYRTKLSRAELRKARGLPEETLSQDARSTGHANQLSERALNDWDGYPETLVRQAEVGLHAGTPTKPSPEILNEEAGVTPRPVKPSPSVEEIVREAYENWATGGVKITDVTLSAIRRATAVKDAEMSREKMEHARTKAELFAAEQSAKSAGVELHQARMSNSKNLVEIARLKEEAVTAAEAWRESHNSALVLREARDEYRASRDAWKRTATAHAREIETWREQAAKLETNDRGFAVHRLKCELAEAKAQLAHTANCSDAYKLQLTAALAQNERMRKVLRELAACSINTCTICECAARGVLSHD